jgi:hypothetical protein
MGENLTKKASSSENKTRKSRNYFHFPNSAPLPLTFAPLREMVFDLYGSEYQGNYADNR